MKFPNTPQKIVPEKLFLQLLPQSLDEACSSKESMRQTSDQQLIVLSRERDTLRKESETLKKQLEISKRKKDTQLEESAAQKAQLEVVKQDKDALSEEVETLKLQLQAKVLP